MSRRREAPVEAASPRHSQGALRRLAGYFAPFKWRLVVLGVLMVLGTVASVVSPYLLGAAVDYVISPSGATPPAWLQVVIGNANRYAGLARIMSLLVIAYIISWALNVVEFRMMVRMSQRILLTMRTQIFDHIQSLSLSFFDTHPAGDLMSRLSNDTQVINDFFGAGITRFARMALSMIGIVISMVALNWRLALVAFAVLPLVVGVTAFFSARVRAAFRRTRETVGAVSAELEENISGIRVVQAFAREAATSREFRAVNAENREANIEAETLMAVFMPLLDIVSTLGLAVVAGYGGYLAIVYTPPLASVGVIVSFLTYVRRFYDPVRQISMLYGQMQSAIAGAERIFELLDTEPEVMEKPDAIVLPPVEGRIEYDDVCFSYVETEPVLDHVSFTIEPGQTFAAVGETGAGKTTLASLLMRFYDVRQGAVRVDGYDVRDVTLDSLRSQIGMVLQDTFLFSGTVMHNIRYGRPDATDEEVIEAAKIANAHDFIMRLPQGYDTEVGERGASLSHGNRQLLAIARAVLKDPRILILDEATSAVDTRTERLIQGALERLLSGRSSLVIAHRLSTIRHAHQIIVLEHGKIVERGTHEELIASRGTYYALYMSQFRREQRVVESAEASGTPA